jgi:glycosyltransferase involved in cell wall biosynthesis
MKIIFDANPLLTNKTGVAYYTEQLVDALTDEYQNDLELVGFYYNFLGRRDTSHLKRGKNLRYSRFSLIPSKIIFQLRRFGIECPVELLAAGHGDFVLYDNFIGYPSLFRTPNAPVIHDLTYIDLPDYVSGKLRRDLVRFMPKTIKRASFVITVSEFSKQRVMEVYNLPADKVVVTHIPPQTPRLRDVAEVGPILQGMGIAKPYILFLGTVEPRKNTPNLIDAYLQLPTALREKYDLVIAGMIGWNCEKEVAKLKETEGQGVIHLGYVSEKQRAALYQQASLFTHASYYEGFGMPVLEAMSYGIPCAISNIPIYREIAGDAALFFNQDDPKAIASSIAQLLTDDTERSRLAGKGKAHSAKYTWKRSAQALYEAIQHATKH